MSRVVLCELHLAVLFPNRKQSNISKNAINNLIKVTK